MDISPSLREVNDRWESLKRTEKAVIEEGARVAAKRRHLDEAEMNAQREFWAKGFIKVSGKWVGNERWG